MAQKMIVIGLTGGSGTGKGYVSGIFAEYGIVSLDTDVVYHYITDHKSRCVDELCAYFGEEIRNPDGSLSRKTLASIVFHKDDTRDARIKALNRITHKYVRSECEEWLAVQRKSGARAAIIDVPLLFESRFDAMCDKTVAVTAPYAKRLARIMKRDGLSEEKARERLDAQPSDAFYDSRADAVLVNAGDDTVLRSAVDALINAWL